MSKRKKNIGRVATGGTKLPGAGHAGVHKDARKPARTNDKARFRKELPG